MALLFLIVVGVIAIIIVKVCTCQVISTKFDFLSFDLIIYVYLQERYSNFFPMNMFFGEYSFCIFKSFLFGIQIVDPKNKDIRDIPGLAPPASRKLLWYSR